MEREIKWNERWEREQSYRRVRGVYAFALLFIIILSGWGLSSYPLSNEDHLVRLPFETVEQLRDRAVTLQQKIADADPAVADNRFLLMHEVSRLDLLTEKHMNVVDDPSLSMTGLRGVPSSRALNSAIDSKYTFGNMLDAGRFTGEEMSAAAKRVEEQLKDEKALMSSSSNSFRPVGMYFGAFFLSLVLLTLPVLLFKLHVESYGISAILGTFTRARFYVALPCGPFGLSFFPDGNPLDAARRCLKFAAYTLASMISLFAGGGMAKAQTGKQDSKTGKSDYSLSIKVSRDFNIEGPPNPADTFKATLAKKGAAWWLSSQTTHTGSGIALTTLAGTTFKFPGGAVKPYGGLKIGGLGSQAPNAVSGVAGGQVFWAGKPLKNLPEIAVISPVNQIEAQITPVRTTRFLSVVQFVAKIRPGLWIGAETVPFKASGNPWSHTTGPVVQWKPAKKGPLFEAGVFRNSFKQWSAGIRLYWTFSLPSP